MKKLVLAVIVILMMSVFEVRGMEQGAQEGIEVNIFSEDCNDDMLDGYHLDMLVRRSQVVVNVLTIQNSNYHNAFGHIDTIDYLLEDDSVWVSYLAYVEDADIYGQGTCHQIFARLDEEYKNYSEIKLVLFNDEGETVYLSDIITIPIADTYQTRHGYLNFFAEEPYQIVNHYSVTSGNALGSFLKLLWYIAIYFGVAFVLGLVVFIYGLIRYLQRKYRGYS